MKKILLFLLISSTCFRLDAQDWRGHYSTALKSYEGNDLNPAFENANNALQAYLKEDGSLSENYASILRLLQNICYADGKLKEGLDFTNKELAVREGKKDENYAGALTQQGTFLQALGDYKAADKSFRQAYEILKQFYKESEFQLIEARVGIGVNAYLADDVSEAFTIFNETLQNEYNEISMVFLQGYYFFGLINREKGDIARALTYFSKTKDIYESQQLTNSAEYAALMMNIGLCYHAVQQWDKAEDFYSKSAQIFQSLKISDGDYATLLNARAVNFQSAGHPEKAEQLFASQSGAQEGPVAAIYLSNKAAISTSRGEYKNAEQLYKQALAKLDRQNPAHGDVYADILQNLATFYEDLAKFIDAEKLLTDAETMIVSAVGPNDFRSAKVKINRANVYSKSGKNSEAKKLYNEALQIISANGKTNSVEWARALSGIGLLFFREGEVQAADSAYASLVNLYAAGTIQKDDTYAATLNNYAAVKQTLGEFHIARKLLAECAKFTRKKSGVMNIAYAKALENLGFIDLDIGAITTARTEIDSALKIYEVLLGPGSITYTMALINQGRYHQNAGEYSLAEPCFKKAYRAINANQEASPTDWIRAANALAVFYQTMGNYEQAEPLFKQMKDKIEKAVGKTSADYATTLQNLATLYQLQGKPELAGPMLEEALAIDKKIYGDSHPQYIIALRNLAALYQKTGKRDNAKILLQLALESTRKIFGEEHASYASTISNLAALYQDEGNMAEAEKAWQQSVALRRKILGVQHPDYARSLYGLATVYFGQGKMDDANEYFRVVIDQYLKQITDYFPSLSEKEKGAFYQKIKPVFDSYQDFCIQYYKKNPGEGFILRDLYNTQLSTKAILLNSSNKVRQTILSSGDTALVNKFKRWLSVKEQIVHYFSLSEEERKQFGEVALLQQRANDLEKQLSLSSSLFKTEFTEREYNSGDISSLLKEGEAAIEIIRIQRKFVADSIYYVGLVIDKNSDIPSLVIWPDGKRMENRFFRFHRNAVKFHVKDTLSFRNYWKPLAAQLGSKRTLYLSADGVFNKINFNILQNNADQHWVLEDYSIYLVSNTKEIVEQRNRKPSSNNKINLYGYADFQLDMLETPHPTYAHNYSLNRNFGFDGDIPVLPGTEKEIDQIDHLLRQQNFSVSTYKKADANEINLKKTPNVKVLHIATHGFFMNDVDVSETEDESTDFFNNPLLRSGILLAGAGVSQAESELSGEDGILTAYEAMNIDLNETDLVVLSACETALGELRNGEGVYGLQRSFLVAGASAVMMSLWQVDDVATQELMVNFYQHWLSGENKHEAFRKAQLMIKEKYSSPYYWGAFILVGQ